MSTNSSIRPQAAPNGQYTASFSYGASNGYYQPPQSQSQSQGRVTKTAGATSASSVHMQDTVEHLRRRCAEELGPHTAAGVVSSYSKVVEWISNERLRHLPTEGSAWDKVLAWAQSFAEKFNDFDLAIEHATGQSYDGAEIAFGYCILLLDLGEENASTLLASFGFFFQRAIDLIALLDRIELFGVSSEITEQLVFGYADLVTLVSNIALRFYQEIRSTSGSATSIDIFTTFSSTIESFQFRRTKIVESMWSHQLSQQNIDTTRIATIHTLRSWLGAGDYVLKYKTGDHTTLVTDRQALTCLWLAPYLTRFLNSNRDSLVITGGVGSGKSVLAGTIVDTLRKTATKRSYSVIFVAIDARVRTYANSLRVAKSILFQFLEHRVGNIQLYRIISDAFEASERTRDLAEYENLLWTTLQRVVDASLSNAKDTIIVVDGLDEVSDDSKDGQTLLKRLKDVSIKSDKVRLITLSQPSALAPNTKPDIEITEDLIYEDIYAVVENIIQKSPHYSSLSSIDQTILIDKVVEASKGSFLWAKMVTRTLNMENTLANLQKAADSIKKNPKPIADLATELFLSPKITEQTRHLVYWLAISERPLTVDELTILHSIEPRKGVVKETSIDVLATLEPAASLVFLRDGLLYLRHTIIKRTLITWFDQNHPVKDPGLDFTLRLLTHLKVTNNQKTEPTFTDLSTTQVDNKFHQSTLVEYAIRYWTIHFLNIPSKTREVTPELKKDLANILPTSPTVALIERTTWTWIPTPTKLAWHSTTTDLRRKVFGDSHVITLQSFINSGLIYQLIRDVDNSATYYYFATRSSTTIYSDTHSLTVQCANRFLDVTSTTKSTIRTQTVTYREEILTTLIESYKKQYGTNSEKVTKFQGLLIELYKSIKEEQKATKVEETRRIEHTHDTNEKDTTRKDTGSRGVQIRRGRKTFTYDEWDFSEDKDRDAIVKIDHIKHIDQLIAQARAHASKNEIAKAEQYYVEAWYLICQQTKSTSSIETHEKKIKLAIDLAEFYKSIKRETESAAILTGVWEEYQHSSLTRTEQISTKLVQVAKLMQSVGLTATALSVYKHCSSILRSLNKTESSSYKEITELEQTTQKELLKQASSSSSYASNISEEVITEIFTSFETSKSTQLDETSTTAIRKLVTTLISQHKYKEATQITKKSLRTTWSSFLSTSIEDVTLTTTNTEFSITQAEELIQCYQYRHRLEKAIEYRERLYHALKRARKIDDQTVQHSITELFRLYERVRAMDKITQLHRELLEEYKKYYGPSHEKVVEKLFILAKITYPEPVSVEYYRQIVTILTKDSETCHQKAIEPLGIVSAHYWNERRYPGATWGYSLLFRTFTQKGKDFNEFQDTVFVTNIYNRYIGSLRATGTDVNTLYDITKLYRTTCIDVFKSDHKVTIDATLYLARVCESSKRYQSEAILLYEELRKESKASEYHAEINQTLEAIYEEQSLEAARSTTVTASSEQISKAVSVIRSRLTKNRSEYGWAHQESLEQLKEVSHLYAKQSKKEEAYKELNEATRQIVTSETSSESLIRGATTIAESYIAINETHRAIDIAEEMRWQLVTKDTSNSQKYNLDVSNVSRSAAIYVAQLEYALRQDTSTSFNEIYLAVLTEVVYYEEFQRSIRSGLSVEAVFLVAARLHSFLSFHQRDVMKRHVENELVSYFLRSDKAKVGDVAQVKTLITVMLEYILTHQVQDFIHSLSLASIEYVRLFLRTGKTKEACDLAQTSFRYINAFRGYRTSTDIKYGLILAVAIANLDSKGEHRQGQFQISGEIIRTVLKAANETGLNLVGIPLKQTNVFITVLGEEKDYVTLEWYLTILWNARETHYVWKPATVLELGYRLVRARFLLGKHELAIHLVTDIAYNLRRVYGATHLSTLEVNVLLSQLCISTGLAYQSQKGAEGIARRYYKRSVEVHESVLRSLTLDPLGLVDEDDVTVMSTEPEPMDLSHVVDKNATQGSYARKHLYLLKLALERFGGYPKGYGEYEALNADAYRAYPDDLQGFSGVEQWDLSKFGHGKAENNDGALNVNDQYWGISSAVSNSNGAAA